MRVLVLNYEFPPIGGGGGDVSKNIARTLVELGAEVRILTAHWGDLARREQVEGYTIYRTPSMRLRADRCTVKEMFTFLLCNIVPSLRLAREWGPDVVHAHFAVPVGPLAYLLKRLYGIPYVITLHGGDVPGFDPKQTAHWYRLLLPSTRPIWQQASFVVAVSPGLRDLALRSYPGIPVSIIPNGIDCECFRPPRDRSDNPEGVTLIFVGRVAEQKGLTYLIRSLPALRGRTSVPFELVVVGDGPLRADMEALAESLKVADRVRFTGWVTQSQVRDYLQRADVFVLPSLMEGLSIALLQAMACGLPVITSDAVGNRDIVHNGQNGYVVPAGDVEACVGALVNLVEDRDSRQRMGQCSRQLVKRYDWHAIGRQYLQLLEMCAGKGDTIVGLEEAVDFGRPHQDPSRR
jgi:glycosyltransferase involved in cell wall biosynthesis